MSELKTHAWPSSVNVLKVKSPICIYQEVQCMGSAKNGELISYTNLDSESGRTSMKREIETERMTLASKSGKTIRHATDCMRFKLRMCCSTMQLLKRETASAIVAAKQRAKVHGQNAARSLT